MKVFALGGYGKTGYAAIKLLAQSDLVSEIAVVGRNLERAEKAAKEIGEKAIAVYADGNDEQELTDLLQGYDILMNAAYNETVFPAIRAAIRTGTHYCDVASGNVLELALELDGEAHGAGITGIVATGVSPCVSNLMGLHVARQLEQVEQLQLGRADMYNFANGHELTPRQWLKDPQESLAALAEFRPFFTWMLQRLQTTGLRTISVYHTGQWVEIDPIRKGWEVPLAVGGTVTAYPYSSTDDVWGALPHDLSTLKPVELSLSPFPPQLHDLLREKALSILDDNTDASTAVNAFYDTFESDPQRWLTLAGDFVPIPKMWVRAVGRKEGRAARCTCWFTPAMWDVGGYFLTSVALAAAVRMILRGDVSERGILIAETAFEPLTFFDEVVAVLADSLPDGKMTGESFEWLE